MNRNCPECGAMLRSIQRLCSHIIEFHDSKMGNMTCNINGCQRTFTNAHAWKTHIRREKCHREATNMRRPYPAIPVAQEPPVNVDQVDNEDEDVNPHVDNHANNPEAPQQMYSEFCSRFQRQFFNIVMKIREKHMLPVSVTNAIIDDVQGPLETYQFNISDIVKRQLEVDAGHEAMNYKFGDEDLFSSLCQLAKSDGALANILFRNYPYSEPIEVVLGRTDGKKDIVHIVKLNQVLSNILSHDDILSSIRDNLPRRRANADTDKLYDLTYPLSPIEENVIDIPLIFYLDEFEPCNPIGARRKIHKLTAVYFTIGSLHIQHRTLLKSGFLYGLSYHSNIKKYGYEKVLRRLVDEFLEQHTENLVIELRGGEKVNFKVYLHLVSADNLSAYDILGMQTNFNHGKFSRYCYADYDNINGITD